MIWWQLGERGRHGLALDTLKAKHPSTSPFPALSASIVSLGETQCVITPTSRTRASDSAEEQHQPKRRHLPAQPNTRNHCLVRFDPPSRWFEIRQIRLDRGWVGFRGAFRRRPEVCTPFRFRFHCHSRPGPCSSAEPPSPAQPSPSRKPWGRSAQAGWWLPGRGLGAVGLSGLGKGSGSV